MNKIPDNWSFLGEHPYTTSEGKTTTIAVYKVGKDYSTFGGFLPINSYIVTASTAVEVINECKAECDRYFAKEQVFDDIPF